MQLSNSPSPINIFVHFGEDRKKILAQVSSQPYQQQEDNHLRLVNFYGKTVFTQGMAKKEISNTKNPFFC